MKKHFAHLYILTIAASLTLASCNEGRRGNGVDFRKDRDEAADAARAEQLRKKKRDADFVFEAVASQYAEIKLCELAIQRSHTGNIQDVAERLQKDHSASLNELKALAQAKAVSIPVEENDDARRTIDRFADESGSEFDKKWCGHMLDMHDENIGKYKRRLDDTDDPELKTYLEKNLVILKTHYALLQECSGQPGTRRD